MISWDFHQDTVLLDIHGIWIWKDAVVPAVGLDSPHDLV